MSKSNNSDSNSILSAGCMRRYRLFINHLNEVLKLIQHFDYFVQP